EWSATTGRSWWHADDSRRDAAGPNRFGYQRGDPIDTARTADLARSGSWTSRRGTAALEDVGTAHLRDLSTAADPPNRHRAAAAWASRRGAAARRGAPHVLDRGVGGATPNPPLVRALAETVTRAATRKRPPARGMPCRGAPAGGCPMPLVTSVVPTGCTGGALVRRHKP